MIRSNPYRAGDALYMKPREDIFSPVQYYKAHTDALALQPNSFAHTVTISYKVVAVFGVTMIWPGCAEVWALVSDDLKTIPFWLHKKILNGIKFYETNLKLRRLQATVKVDFEMGHKWIKALGFKEEGILREYGVDGSDFYIYGKVS